MRRDPGYPIANVVLFCPRYCPFPHITCTIVEYSQDIRVRFQDFRVQAMDSPEASTMLTVNPSQTAVQPEVTPTEYGFIESTPISEELRPMNAEPVQRPSPTPIEEELIIACETGDLVRLQRFFSSNEIKKQDDSSPNVSTTLITHQSTRCFTQQ